MRRSLIIAAIAALLLVGSVVPAGADSPFGEVSLEVNTEFSLTAPPNGSFSASGPAFDEVCETGWSFDAGGKFSPREPQTVANIQAVKVFLCGATSWTDEAMDGFVMRLQIHFDKKGGTMNWVAIDGWGAYEGIAGNGDGSSSGSMAGGIIDSLSGKIR